MALLFPVFLFDSGRLEKPENWDQWFSREKFTEKYMAQSLMLKQINREDYISLNFKFSSKG